ncbi:MAG: hypothetical protein R3C56_21605 [Pirellulaceae bacterium]
MIFVLAIDRCQQANPLATGITATRLTSSGAVKEAGTTNPLDPGLKCAYLEPPGNPSTFLCASAAQAPMPTPRMRA